MNVEEIKLCKDAIISISEIIENLSNKINELEKKIIDNENKNKIIENNNIIKQKKREKIQESDEYKIKLIRSRRANNY